MYLPVGYTNGSNDNTSRIQHFPPPAPVANIPSIPNRFISVPLNHQVVNYSTTSNPASTNMNTTGSTVIHNDISPSSNVHSGIITNSIPPPYPSSSSPPSSSQSSSSHPYNYHSSMNNLHRYHNVTSNSHSFVPMNHISNNINHTIPNLVSIPPSNSIPSVSSNGATVYSPLENSNPHLTYVHQNNHFSPNMPLLQHDKKIDRPHLPNYIHPPLQPQHSLVQQSQNHLRPHLTPPQLPIHQPPPHQLPHLPLPSIPSITSSTSDSFTHVSGSVTSEEQTSEKSPPASTPKTVSNPPPTQLQVTLSNEKKRRGRPKKLIFDPSLNEYIDSSHPNFKHLNKELKDNERIQQSHNDSNDLAESISATKNDSIAKLHHQPTYLRKLDDDAVKQLMQKKDRRGRPRKFPVEQTGLTIKGIRVNGNKKKKGV